MMKLLVAALVFTSCLDSSEAHGAMITPAPRSAHSQTFDLPTSHCGASEPYSKTGMYGGEYCGLGCLGDACLYYQVGCFAGCGSCSLTGKTLYPVAADVAAAGCDASTLPAPTLGGGNATLERILRTHNVDKDSTEGDWTKWNPWRSPGSAGKGNPTFQPCGINSGASASASLPPTTAHDVPLSGNGTDLPALPKQEWATWRAGSVVEAEWAIYANHAGGYAYRLCRKEGKELTEECYQQGHLEFASPETEIRYKDGSRKPFNITSPTTDVGTWPEKSQWRKNPVPMCNCDAGTGCKGWSGNHTADTGKWPSKTGMFVPYKHSNFRPGQSSDLCPTGVQFPTLWDEGASAGIVGKGGFGTFMFTMVDRLKVPDVPAGEYSVSWRWDCEETAQVWNSCADITITK